MELESLNKVLGIELHLGNENAYSGRFCLVEKRKNELLIVSKKTINGQLGKVITAFPKANPVALSLTGKGIIHKNIQIAKEITKEQVFKEAFPSVDQKDFYIQQFVQGEHATVSMVRKEIVDDLLAKLKRAGLKIYTLSLGALPTINIWPQLNIYGSIIQFDGHEFNCNEERSYLNYKVVPGVGSAFPIKIEQEIINQEHILAYAVAFQLVLHQRVPVIETDVVAVKEDFDNFLFNWQLKKKSMVFLFALFALLLLSFMLFSHYNNENAKLTQKVGAQMASADQTDLLKKNIASNEYLLKQLNWNGGYNYGFLLNEVGQSMPKQLSLQEIAVNELKTEAEQTERSPNMRITGTTNNLVAVNNWIFLLKEKNWVKSARLLKYQEDAETGDYQFTLMLTY